MSVLAEIICQNVLDHNTIRPKAINVRKDGEKMILGDLPVGSIITDKKTKFNNRPIKWLIADHGEYLLSSGVRTQATLLLSRDILTCRPFSDKSYTESIANNWEYSEIRDWLNNDFRDYVSINLLEHIWSIRLSTDDQKTDDTFFLLSCDEVGLGKQENTLALFKNNSLYRVAEACPGLSWYWWLRSPFAGGSYFARVVSADGSLNGINAYIGNLGVRPAFIISDSVPVKRERTGGYKFVWEGVSK